MKIISKTGNVNDIELLSDQGEDLFKHLSIMKIDISCEPNMPIFATLKCRVHDSIEFNKVKGILEGEDND